LVGNQGLSWIFWGGKLVQAVTSIVLVNATAKTQDTTVGTGKRWLLLGIKAVNGDDVTRNITMSIYKEAAKTNLLRNLYYEAAIGANGGVAQWPNCQIQITNYLHNWAPILLEAGNTISVVWASGGASTGSTDADGLVVEYLEVDV